MRFRWRVFNNNDRDDIDNRQFNPKKMSFKPGQSVTLKERTTAENWFIIYGPTTEKPLPKFGEVYTVAKSSYEDGVWYISLVEIDPETGFDAAAFELVVSTLTLCRELESVPEPYTI